MGPSELRLLWLYLREGPPCRGLSSQKVATRAGAWTNALRDDGGGDEHDAYCDACLSHRLFLLLSALLLLLHCQQMEKRRLAEESWTRRDVGSS